MISYETTAGDEAAPWITLVHGFAHNRRYFAGALSALSERYRILQVDLRGHGQSADVGGPYGLAEYSRDVAEVLDHEQIARTDVWGSHAGTGVALVLAATRPSLVGKLVLEGAVLPGYPMPRSNWLRVHAEELARAKGVASAMTDWFEEADWFTYEQEHPEQTNAAGQWELLQEFTGAPLLSELPTGPVPEVFGELGSLTQPLLVYNGEHDLPEFREVASVLAESVNDAERREIPAAGAYPLWENPQAVLRLVLDFLD
ncbi:MAG: 3-oxoadipate enol-lactonase [Acidimicrobiaceae bacterium]|nr:3-oxoadipate enol-lactonase [Acidimicrobiaceae bacterium]